MRRRKKEKAKEKRKKKEKKEKLLGITKFWLGFKLSAEHKLDTLFGPPGNQQRVPVRLSAAVGRGAYMRICVCVCVLLCVCLARMLLTCPSVRQGTSSSWPRVNSKWYKWSNTPYASLALCGCAVCMCVCVCSVLVVCVLPAPIPRLDINFKGPRNLNVLNMFDA